MTNKLKIIIASAAILLLLIGGGFCIFLFARPSKNAKIIATIFPIYDIAREIMGNENDLMLLEDSGVDIHNYTPTTSDMTAISKCELFMYIGGESDKWVSDVLKTTNNANLYTIKLIDEIEAVEESSEGIIDGEHHHEENHEENEEEHEEKELDEHIWLSPKNLIIITNKIKDSLEKIFPERREVFRINAEKYIQKLTDIDAKYSKACQNSENTLIVADRFPFAYLVRDYGIKYYACFSGCSTETQASADMISSLIQKINSENANYICVLETSDKVIANSVISDKECKKNIKIETLNSCQSVSALQLESTSLIDILNTNLNVLTKVMSNENN